MKITFIGVGSAFTRKNYNTCALLEITTSPMSGSGENVHRMLIDCGRNIPEGLREAGYDWKDIHAIYVTHQHSDHIGGIEDMAFYNFFVTKKKPTMFGDGKLLVDLWDHSLRGGLEFLEERVATLDTYFNVSPVDVDEFFNFAGVKFHVWQGDHVYHPYGTVFSYGLNWTTDKGKHVFFSADSKFPSDITQSLFKEVDVIFHDCETIRWKENDMRSGVHAHYNYLKTLPPEIKAKMYLMHYNDGDLPNAIEDGFAGFVQKGQVFEL